MWHDRRWQHPQGNLHSTQGPPHGRRLVFLHGVLRSWETFLPLLAPLSVRFELTGLDLRGHGRSAKPETGYGVVDYVQHLRPWLAEVASEPVVLYGHSLGAMIALQLAAIEPQHVAGIVLEDPPFHTMGERIGATPWQSYFRQVQPLAGSTRPVTEVAAALAEIMWGDPQAGRAVRLGDVRDGVSLRFLAHTLRQVCPAVLDPVIAGAWLRGYDLAKIAADVRCPVLLLQADSTAGGTLSDADVAQLRLLVNDLSTVRFAHAGHNLHTARTQEIVNLVFAFVESLSGS
jgi:pimeloyl-ACP methyl ester carboxylesterase